MQISRTVEKAVLIFFAFHLYFLNLRARYCQTFTVKYNLIFCVTISFNIDLISTNMWQHQSNHV